MQESEFCSPPYESYVWENADGDNDSDDEGPETQWVDLPEDTQISHIVFDICQPSNSIECFLRNCRINDHAKGEIAQIKPIMNDPVFNAN